MITTYCVLTRQETNGREADLGVQESIATMGIAPDTTVKQQSVMAFAVACANVSSVPDEQDMKALNMPPLPADRGKHVAITEGLVLAFCHTQLFANVTYLNLHNNAIRKMEGLGMLVNLQKLILRFNEIQKIEVCFLYGCQAENDTGFRWVV